MSIGVHGGNGDFRGFAGSDPGGGVAVVE